MKWKKGTGKEEARVGREGRKETSGLDNVWIGRNGAEWWNTGPFSQPQLFLIILLYILVIA